MFEAELLLMVRRYPDRRALARRVRAASLFVGLERLEAEGLVTRRRERFTLTRLGAFECDMELACAHLASGDE
jgi:hypothetical protein